MNKYNPRHRRTIRLKGVDYSKAGLYYITLCCQDRTCLFGEIINKEMTLNDAGNIVNECWTQIPNHFASAILHNFIIMPNHIHGIIELAGANCNSPRNCNSTITTIINFK